MSSNTLINECGFKECCSLLCIFQISKNYKVAQGQMLTGIWSMEASSTAGNDEIWCSHCRAICQYVVTISRNLILLVDIHRNSYILIRVYILLQIVELRYRKNLVAHQRTIYKNNLMKYIVELLIFISNIDIFVKFYLSIK